MGRLLLILDDDQDRLDRFCRTFGTIDPSGRCVVWKSARRMLREVDEYLAEAALMTLDHDLYPSAEETEDPGDGLEVVRHLGLRPPTCPVIVHSSNADRVQMMAGELELGKWIYRTMPPFGKDWIETYWAGVVRRLLRIE